MVHYKYKVLGIFFGLFLVLFNYQNCSSPSGAGELQSNPTESMIDTVQTSGLEFIEEKISLKVQDTDLTVYGVCSAEQNGSLIGWKLFDSEQNLVEKGRSACNTGAFEVAFEGTDSIACGSSFKLKAQFGAKDNSEVEIAKPCL